MATCPSLMHGCALVLRAAAAEQSHAARRKAASSDVGAKKSPQSTLISVGQLRARHSPFTRTVATGEGILCGESGADHQKHVRLLPYGYCIVAVGRPPTSRATLEQGQEREAAEDTAAITCGRTHFSGTLAPAATQAAANATAGSVRQQKEGAGPNGSGDPREIPVYAAGTSGDGAFVAISRAAAADVVKRKKICCGETAAAHFPHFAASAIAGDAPDRIRVEGGAAIRQTQVTFEEDKQKQRFVCWVGRTVRSMCTTAAFRENPRMLRTACHKRSRSCTATARSVVEEEATSCDNIRCCVRCCRWCSYGSEDETYGGHALVQVQQRDLKVQEQRRSTQHNAGIRQGNFHQCRSCRSSCILHWLVAHAAQRSRYWNFNALRGLKAAVYAAGLLLAFICGKMYGTYTVTSKYGVNSPCSLPPTSCDLIASTHSKERDASAERRMPSFLEDAAVPGATAASASLTPGSAASPSRHGHTEAAPVAAATHQEGDAAVSEAAFAREITSSTFLSRFSRMDFAAALTASDLLSAPSFPAPFVFPIGGGTPTVSSGTTVAYPPAGASVAAVGIPSFLSSSPARDAAAAAADRATSLPISEGLPHTSASSLPSRLFDSDVTSTGVSAVEGRRLLDVAYPSALQKSANLNGDRVRGEHPQGGSPAPRDDAPRTKLEAKLRKRLAGASPRHPSHPSQEKKKDSSSPKRTPSDKAQKKSGRPEGAGQAAQPPGLLDPHIFRKELCPFLRTGDTQLKSWFALLVLYIAEWPAYAYTGNGGRRFIDQLRYYAENFRSPPSASEHGKKLFDDEIACGTTEVFKEGLAALKDRIHNFSDMTRVLKHLAKSERDFADLLDYTQYSKLPARAAVTGFALLLRTAFEGMVFSFCKSVFLRKGFKGNFNRKELYSNVVWLYHRTQTQYWMLLLVGKIIKQMATGRPHTGIVVLRSEENPRFRTVGDSSSLSSASSSAAYGTGTKGQMLEVLYGVGAYSALQRIVSGTIRKKVGWALSRFEELASEKGERSSAKGVLQPHVFVTGYYGKTSRGTEVREGLFGSEVEAEALEEMMEDLPAGHVLLQISLVDEWIFRDPADWSRLHKSEADVLTAYTAVQMLRAELAWDPSLGSLGAFSVAYTGVTDLYSRQRTTAEQRRYDPDVHVLLMDDATRFVQTASEEGCRSRIISIVSEDPLQLRRSVPPSRISIRGTAKLLPSGELFRKGSFGMGLSLELQRSAEKRLRLGYILIHVYVRGLNRRSPDTDDLDYTASELVSRLLQRSEGYYDVPVVKMVTPLTTQSLIPRGVINNCAHTVPDWVVIVSTCSIGLFFLAMIVLLMYHEKLKLPWWLHCFCSSSSPWSREEELPPRNSPEEIPGDYGKRHRRATSRSVKDTDEQEATRDDAEGAADAVVSVATAEEGEGADNPRPSRGEETCIKAERDSLEPSTLTTRAGSTQAEEARGWLPAAAKWVGDRSLSTSSQLLKNHATMGSFQGEKEHAMQQYSIESCEFEQDEDGRRQFDGRSSSRQLVALGSASTSASTFAHPGLHHDISVDFSDYRASLSLTKSAGLILQHEPWQPPFSRRDSQRDRDETNASADKKENARCGSAARAPAAYSPLHYVPSGTLSYSDFLMTVESSDKQAASPPSEAVHQPENKDSHADVSTPPVKDLHADGTADSGAMQRVKTTHTGEQHAQPPDIEVSLLPQSLSEKQASLSACAAGPVTRRRSLLESFEVPVTQQLLLAGTYAATTEGKGTASSGSLQGVSSASQAAKCSRVLRCGASGLLVREESYHDSMSDGTLHDLEEFA